MDRRAAPKRAIAYHLEGADDLGECDLDTLELKARLLELFRAPGYTPPLLPAVALELLAVTRKPNASFGEVVQLLGHDPMLAGQVLNIARSALYSTGEPPRSLEEAVMRLGLARVADLFLRVSLETTVFRAAAYREPMDQLRRHSAFTAEAARLVSQQTCGLNEYAFLCGLLHDVGSAACILALSGPLKQLAPAGFARAWPCVRQIHESCSELLAKLWGLPADAALVLQLHHAPRVEGRVHPLAAVVRLADSFATRAGFGFMSEGNPEDFRESAAMLGLSESDLTRLTGALEQLAARFTG